MCGIIPILDCNPKLLATEIKANNHELVFNFFPRVENGSGPAGVPLISTRAENVNRSGSRVRTIALKNNREHSI